MELDIYWTQLAQDKLEDIYYFHKVKAGQGIAMKLVNGIVDATIALEKQPTSGQIESRLASRRQEFRYLVHRNYKIIYWISETRGIVEIANVFDCRRNPEKIEETY